MFPFKKTLSLLVIVCFLINEISFGYEANAFKLAVPSKLSSTEFQHVAMIEIGVREALKGTPGIGLQELVNLGERSIERRSVFGRKVEGSILFREAEELGVTGDTGYAGRKTYGIRAVIGGVYYGCVISMSGRGEGYEIVVVPYDVYVRAKTSGSMKVIRDAIDESARTILNRYIEHEISTEYCAAIDPWIAAKMQAGNYAVDAATAARSPLYKHPARRTYGNENVDARIAELGRFLKSAGLDNSGAVMSALAMKPLVFIPYAPNEQLPRVNMPGTGNTPTVTAHSSQFATYVFVPQDMYEEITMSKKWSPETAAHVEKELVHEAGAVCGLYAAIMSGAIVNHLDMAYRAYKAQGAPAQTDLGPEQQYIKKIAPVNLLELEKRNDYASGKVPEVKGVFKRAIALIIAALGINVAAATAQINVPPVTGVTTDQINLPAGSLLGLAPAGAQSTVTDGASINMASYSVLIGSGTDKAYSGSRLMSENINGVRHVYAGFTSVGTNDLQQAIDSADPGSIVIVKAGTYTGNIRLKNGAKVMGGYSEAGVRDLSATPSIIRGRVFAHDIASPSELNGFTIKVQGGSRGLDVNNCTDNFTVINNTIAGEDGLDLTKSYNMGIVAVGSQAVICNNTITNCYWFGIYANESSLTVMNNKIFGNYLDGVQALGDDSLFENNIFWNNGIAINRGSHFLFLESVPTLRRNTIYGDEVGIFNWSSTPTLIDNIFVKVAQPVFRAPGTTNNPVESGTVNDPAGNMNLGIDPANGQYNSTVYPDKGFNTANPVRDYNKIPVSGLTIDYNTGTNTWAGGGYSYDVFATTNVIESVDLSGYAQFIVGVQGDVTRVKMEVEDAAGHKASVYLDQVVSSREGLWYVSSSLFAGVDLTSVRYMFFIVEGQNIHGKVSLQTISGAIIPRDIPPTSGLTTNDINLATAEATLTAYPAGATSSASNDIASGICTIAYATGTNQSAWAAGGYTYDNFGTTNAAEGVDLSRLSSFVIGVRGTQGRVKVEVKDTAGNVGSIYLTGVTGTEQFYSIPTSLLSGVDMRNIGTIMFVGEGNNQTGTIYVRTLTKAPISPYDIAPTSGLTAGDANLIMPLNGYFKACSPNSGYLSMTEHGFRVDSGGSFMYAMGGGYNFAGDVDFSEQAAFIVGLKGQLNTAYLTMYVTDADGTQASVVLNSVDGTQKFWSIPTVYLRGIDLTRVRSVNFGWSGYNLAGSWLDVYGAPTALSYNVDPSGSLTSGDINVPNTRFYPLLPEGASSAVYLTGVGFHDVFSTGTNGWAGAGLSYDIFNTTPIETFDLGGLSQFIVGVYGTPGTIKMIVVDMNGNEASVYLQGVTSTQQIWAIPVSMLPGVDMSAVRVINFIVEGVNVSGTFDVHASGTYAGPVNVPYDPSLTPANINLPTQRTAPIFPAGASATATNTSNGMSLVYDTGTNTWAGGIFNYDLTETPGVTETVDLSVLENFIIGLKGTAQTVKFEVEDSAGNKASVNLKGVDPAVERVWSVNKGLLTGVDFTRVKSVNIVVEGTGKAGTLQVHSSPATPFIPNVPASAALTANDINLATMPLTMTPHPAGASSTVTTNANGIQIDYTTGTGADAWAGGSYSFDNLGTTNIMESVNLAGYANFIIGLKGDPARVKMEIEDVSGAKAVVYLIGITSSEQVWSVPTTLLTGIDPTRVRFINFIVEGDSLSGTLMVHTRPDQPTIPNIAPAAGVATNDINLTTMSMTRPISSPGAQASVSNTASGLTFNFNNGTDVAAWSGARFAYDDVATTNAAESCNLMDLWGFRIGLRGSVNTVKMEVEDYTGKKAVLYLTGIDTDTEKVWSIDPLFMSAVDLTKVAGINFVVEGANKAGTLYIHTIANAPIAPTIPYTPGMASSDINLPATYTIELLRATIAKNASGISLNYATGPDGWAGGGLSYDNLGTPPVESRDLSAMGYLNIGLKGGVSKVKMEIEDAAGKKAVVYLDGIDVSTERIWSVPTAYLANIDLTHVRYLFFIIEGANLTGTLDVHVVPESGYGYAMTGAPALAPQAMPGSIAMPGTEGLVMVPSDRKPVPMSAGLFALLGLLRKAERRKKEKPGERPAEEKKAAEMLAIASLGRSGYLEFPGAAARGTDAVDRISEILWEAGQGAIPRDEARARLAKVAAELTPSVAGEASEVYDAWIDHARSIMLAMALTVEGKHKKPDDLDILAVAKRVKESGIEVFVPASQVPGGVQPQFRRILDTVFGDRLTFYQRIEDLAGMIKNPEKSIVMTVDLTDNDIASLEKLKTDLRKLRFMNFENVDIKKLSKEELRVELENYLAETISILLVARAITADDTRDKASPMYRMLSHLLESRMAETSQIDSYIAAITDVSVDPISKLRYLLKAILKAMPVAVYKLMKPAVEVLWSA